MTDEQVKQHWVSTYAGRENWLMQMLRKKSLTPGARLTCTALASHLNFETGLLCPSMATLARETAQTHRAVQRHVARVRSLGHIQVEKVGRAYRYKLALIPNSGTSGPVLKAGKATGHSRLRNQTGDQLVADIGTASRKNRRPAVLSNLELETLEKNLGAPAALLSIAPGLRDLQHWAFDGCAVQPPSTLIFASRMRMEAALKAFGQKLTEAGLRTTWSGAP